MDWSESGPHPRGQVIQLYDSGGLSGYDYEGCPVWFDLVGKLDPKGLLLSASPQELIRKRIRVCEMLVQQCELQSQKVSSQGWDRGRMVGPVCLEGGPRTREARHPNPALPQPSALQALVGHGLPQSLSHEHVTCAWHPLLV